MDRRLRWLGIALLAAVAVVLLFVFRVFGPARWPEGTTFVPRDVDTIQQALEQAAPGSTIVLEAGGDPTLGPATVDTPDVTVVSSRGTVILSASGPEAALTVRADGVTIRGLTIDSESIGIRIEATRCTIEDVRVDNTPIGLQLVGAQECELRGVEVDGGRTGVELSSSGGNLLTDLTIRGSTESGVKALDSRGNVLEDIEVLDAPIGISLMRGSAENEVRGCRVERASIAGIEFRGAIDNLLVGSCVRDARIGVILEGVTGNRVDDCEIEGAAVAGLLLQQALLNRATGNRISASEGAGIHLTQSAENAFSYNRIDDCAVGVRLEGGDRNLLIGNRIGAVELGIDADRSSDGRVLRNVVRPSGRIGIRLSGGSGNHLFDNHVSEGEWGILLTGSPGNTLLRNRIEGQETAGLCLVNGSQATYAAEGHLRDCGVGVLIADAARSDLLDNRVTRNDTGLLLVRSGPGIRIEGNTVEGNRIGLRHADESNVPGIDEILSGVGDAATPILANNLFVGNDEFDVSNETLSPIFAAGNWWDDAANVSDGVDLAGSAWRGTVAIGTEADVSQELLGRILQQALTASGFRVIDLIGMGTSERVLEAFRAEDVDFVWWGTSETALAGGEDGDAEVILTAIPASSHWIAVVPEATAQGLEHATLSAYAARLRETGEGFRYAATAAFDDSTSAAFEEAYTLRAQVESVNRAESLEEVETLLKLGAVDMAIAGNLEETLTFSSFVPLEDDLGIFESVDLLVASRSGFLERYPAVEDLLARLGDSLTTASVHNLISRVRLLQEPAETVARDYLIAQGLLEE